ncbi:hypothetical protein CVT26_000229 [Gymnopilus dilepis]|uniref:AB hydrolase-1 domain-containing protein n=1 Tax=Gymnopilus dilepis TaxID=231916 RepID=A0A409VG83_9AGAR|nr:hypothetical protein CVT26_000229 [Gymnopilus dilepis]
MNHYSEAFEIVLPTGVTLRANLDKPSGTGAGPNKLAVCLHPWSWLGGRKDDPVLSYLAEPLLSHNYHVLRFNSRGVGGSSGWASLTGFKEVEDLKAVIQWALENIPGVESLVILGYSHGSLVASMHPVLDNVKTSHILLSYPIGPRGFLTLFNSSSYTRALNDLVHHPRSNVLIIFGDCDEFTSQSKYKAWAAGLEAENVEIHEVEDERPRQSVANLIGRFETQNKRVSQALSAGSPSRSSSVVSHITGDSAREEVKEKREWPPKSVTEGDKSPPSRSIPPALVTQSSWKKTDPNEEPDVPLTAKALNASERQTKGEPNTFLENWRKDLPTAPVDVEPEPTPAAPPADDGLKTPKPPATPKVGAPSTAAPRTSSAAKAATSKVPISAASKPSTPASKTTAKTPVKSPAPKQSLTPLKPQHTGQSVASSAATTTRKSVAKAPVTPASAKTPSRAEASTPAKTPTSTPRPKSPSSGLFAPTAASLARSRNAAPPVPTPTKKSTISSSSMDRLSKPTAASKAKIASPPSLSPARPAASPASRTTSAKPATAKPKVATSPSKVKKASSAPQAAGGAAVGLASVASAAEAGSKEVTGDDAVPTVEPASSDAAAPTPADQATEEGTRSVEEAPHAEERVHEEAALAHEQVHEEAALAEETHEEEGLEEAGEEAKASADEESGSSPASPAPEAKEALEETADPSPETEEETVEDTATGNGNHEVKDDLEQMVNLLESVSITKPHEDTTADIPDEILEIPDEEEK